MTAAADEHPRRDTRLRRWLRSEGVRRARRVGTAVLLVLGIVWTLEAVVLPVLVRSIVARTLTGLGFAHATFDVHNVSPFEAELVDVVGSAAGGPRVDVLIARYTPWSIVHGRLTSIDLIGATVTLDLDDPTFGRTEPAGASGPSAGADAGGIPLDLIRARASSFILRRGGRSLRLPTYATGTVRGSAVQIDVTTLALSSVVRLAGTVDAARGAVDVAVDAPTVDSAQIGAVVLPLLKETPAPSAAVRWGGEVAVAGHYRVHTHHDGLTFSVRPQAAWMIGTLGSRSGAIDGLDGELRGALDRNWNPQSFDARFTTARLRLGTVNLEGLAAQFGAGVGRDGRLSLAPAARLTVDDVKLPDLSRPANGGGKPILLVEAAPAPTTQVVAAASTASGGVTLPDLRLTFSPLAFGGTEWSGGSLDLRSAVIGSLAGGRTIDFDVRTAGGSRLSQPSAAIDVRSVGVRGSLSADGGSAAALRATASLDAGVRDPAGRWTVDRVSLSVPVSLNAPAPGEGKVTIDGARFGSFALKRITGTAGVTDGAASLNLTLPLLADAAVRVTGRADLAGATPTFDLRATLPPTKLTDPKTLAATFPAAGDATLTGSIGFDAAVRSGAAPQVKLSLADVSASRAAWDAEVGGLSGTVALTEFSPIETPGQQTLTAKSLRIGKLALSDGTFAFQVENAHSLLVEQTQWGWAGGRLYTTAFRIDPAKPNADLAVWADGLEVKPLLDLIAGQKATGGGTLYGRLPVSIRWPTLEFGDGFLYAAPGEGELKLGDEVGKVGQLLDQSDPRFNSDPQLQQVKADAIEALRDFQYSLFKTTFHRDATGGLTATIQIEGKGKTVRTLHGLNLNVNISGLDSVLRNVIAIKKIASSIGS